MKKTAIIILTLLIGSPFTSNCQSYMDYSSEIWSSEQHNLEPFTLFKIKYDEKLCFLALSSENISVYESVFDNDSSTIVLSDINPYELLWDKSNYSHLTLIRYLDINRDQFPDLVLIDADGSLFYSLFDLKTNRFRYPNRFLNISGERYLHQIWVREGMLYSDPWKKHFSAIDLCSFDLEKEKFEIRKFKEDVILVNSIKSDSISILWRENDNYYYSLCKDKRNPELQNEKTKIATRGDDICMIDYPNSNFTSFIVLTGDTIWYRSGRDMSGKDIVYSGNSIRGEIYSGIDIDGDGDVDPLIYSDSIAVLFALGEGKFEIQKLDVLFDLKGISLCDFDNDKDYDLFVNSHDGLHIFILENGRFKFFRNISFAPYLDFYYLYDIDLDGKKDLLLKNEYDKELYWSKFEGSQFNEPKLLLNSELKRCTKTYSLD